MLYVFVTFPSCDVITIGTVIVLLPVSNVMFSAEWPSFASVSPILIFAYSFSDNTSIKALFLFFPIVIILVGTESIFSNVSKISTPST